MAYTVKSKKSAKNKEYCMRQSTTFLQLAKGSLMSLELFTTGYQIPFTANYMWNPPIACKSDNISNILRGEINLK
jgi:hypothetical protein